MVNVQKYVDVCGQGTTHHHGLFLLHNFCQFHSIHKLIVNKNKLKQ